MRTIKNDPNNYITHNLYKHNISQVELCKILKISKHTLLDWTNLKIDNLTMKQVETLCSIFGVCVEEFMYCLLRNRTKLSANDVWYLDNIRKAK